MHNYYYEYDRCGCCGRVNRIHVGGESRGWPFTFRGYNANDEDGPGVVIHTLSEWYDFMNANLGVLMDEFGKPMDVVEFIKWVGDKRGERGRTNTGLSRGQWEWMDPHGFCFVQEKFC